MMETTIEIAVFGLILAILLAWVRMAKGPTVMDRILCFDVITVCVVGMMILLAIKWDTDLFLELMLVVSLLGFLSGVAFVFYLEKTLEVREPDPEAGTGTDGAELRDRKK
jgi:multicomponent Na+:H+ antiporter subunit F